MSDEEDFASILEAVFAAVVAKARTDKDFARQLARAVGDPGRLASAAARARDWRSEAPSLDLHARLAAEGAEGVRQALRPLTRRQLYALVRVDELSPARTSALNKSQLIEHIVSVLVRAQRPARRTRRAFDY